MSLLRQCPVEVTPIRYPCRSMVRPGGAPPGPRPPWLAQSRSVSASGSAVRPLPAPPRRPGPVGRPAVDPSCLSSHVDLISILVRLESLSCVSRSSACVGRELDCWPPGGAGVARQVCVYAVLCAVA